MNLSRVMFKNTLIYFIGQVLSKLIVFILLPIYTNYISTSDFGYYDLSLSVLGVVVPVIFLEIWTSVLRFAIEKKTDEEKKVVVNNTLTISFVSLIIYSFVFLFGLMIFKFRLPLVMYIYSILWVVQLILLNATRLYGKNVLYASSGVISVFVNTVVTIVFVKFLNAGIYSLYYGLISSVLVQNILIERDIHLIRDYKFGDFDKDLCKEIIKFSFPLSINSIVYWMMEGFNKIIISNKLGIAENGIYAVSNRLSTVLNLVIQVFILSWQEAIFKIEDIKQKEMVYSTGFNLMIKIVGGAIVVLLPVMNVIFPFFVGEAYSSSKNLLPFLLLIILVNALSSILTSCFTAEKDSKSILHAKIISCVINVTVLFITIDKIGLYASPIALFFANFFGIVTQIRIMKKNININVEKSTVFIFVVLYIASLLIYIYTSASINMIWFVISLLFYIVYLRDFIKKVFDIVVGMLSGRR